MRPIVDYNDLSMGAIRAQLLLIHDENLGKWFLSTGTGTLSLASRGGKKLDQSSV
jgi:hypothetical protein